VIKKLRGMGVVVVPVAANSNYLSVSFVTLPAAADKDIQLLLPLKKQLVWLKLSDTKITDVSMGVLAQCSNLTRLQLDSTGITDKGLSSVSGLSQLQMINLVATKISAAGLLLLKDLKALQSVYVYKTGIKSTDWVLLKKSFPKLRIDTGGYTVPLFETDTSLVKPPKQPEAK